MRLDAKLVKVVAPAAAREALNRALSTLDDGDMRAAAAWASIAAETIEACELTPEEQRDLVAPRDDTPLGERVFFVSVIPGLATRFVE